MRGSIFFWLVFLTIAATAFAALYDFALIAGRVLAPWLGWMWP